MWHNNLRGRRGLTVGLALLLALAVFVTACGKKSDNTKPPGSGAGTIIAEYKEGGTVTDKEFDRYLGFLTLVNTQAQSVIGVSSIREQFLKEYIGYKVLYARADEKAKDAAKDDVKMFIDQFKQAVDSSTEMKAEMEKSGLTIKDAEWFYRMIITVMENSEQQVTDAELKVSYDKAPEDFNNVSLRHILIGFNDPVTGEEKLSKADALKKAEEVKQKLESGGDWEALAKEYSDDEGSQGTGGLYENKEPRIWVEAFAKAANTQEIGAIGDPVETEYGYHIIKVEKREARTWEQVPEATKEELRRSASTLNLNKFMSEELEGMITKLELPKDDAAADEADQADQADQTDQTTEDEGQASTSEEKTEESVK
ncbi:peptidylprolyl isomerase [Paenibacillus xylaniclasticus]|uniref:peptidylprolyl isomerase n=1 Tax=Paenibacillus xylaniclasticus TaxID=588083 RepID=UPI000FDB2490|nr:MULTISPECIES: peptidylprolyl isomerase [Paenibacillus]GFN33760.1 peptidylprolyl isomerase [Paenibacillus curdlanolyticus]